MQSSGSPEEGRGLLPARGVRSQRPAPKSGVCVCSARASVLTHKGAVSACSMEVIEAVCNPRPPGLLPPCPFVHPGVTPTRVSYNGCCVVCSVASRVFGLPAVPHERLRPPESSSLLALELRSRTGCLKVSWSGFKFKQRQPGLGRLPGGRQSSRGRGLLPPSELHRLRGQTAGSLLPPYLDVCLSKTLYLLNPNFPNSQVGDRVIRRILKLV